MKFEGERSIATDEQNLWDLISDPEVLVRCVPGAKEVERKSETHYTGVIERSFAGLSVNLDGEVELTELRPPEQITIEAHGRDRVTKTEMNADGELSLLDGDDGKTVLDYWMELSFTGKLPAHLLKGRFNKDIDRFFDNIQDVAENGLEAMEAEDSDTDEDAEDEDDGGLLSRF